jgi:uncharacterized protein (TIGR02145 family)
VPASLLADAPSTIPLWHYSESQGYWVREGEATLNSNVYEGEVSHFSFWNCDIPAEAVLYNLTLLNDELVGSAIPIEGAHVVITSNVFGAQDGYTDSNGMVSGLIPANELLEVSVYVVCGNSETLVYNATIGPITEDYSNNWSIDLSSIVAMLQGTLLSASGSPIDGYVYLTSGGYVSTLNGSYQLPACTGSGELTGWYYDGGDICTSNSITVNLNTGINEYDIQVLGCFSISQPGEGVTDIDGNFYPSIIIAEQEWMASNLRTTRYANGDVIPELQEGSLWDNTTNGAWCDYANDNSLDIVFGKLYNGYAVVDNRNVCPTGWHVPTEEEVENMLFVLDPETELYSEIAGGMLKQEGNIVDGNGLWAYPNEGASNATGFAAVPGGWRIEGFGFSEGDSLAAILTRPQSLSNPPDEFLLLMMEYSNTQGGLFGAINVQGGGSIRCVRD